MSHTAAYKPSPLSYASPQRASPFRRPESPASPSPLRNSTTPTPSPTKPLNLSGSPSKLQHQQSPILSTSSRATEEEGHWTPRGLTPSRDTPTPRREQPPASPTRGANTAVQQRGTSTFGEAGRQGGGDMNALSKLQPAQVRELREGFQILDRDSNGVVGREDVADMLHQLGLPSSNADLSPFFPPLTPQTLTLATYLTSISTLLASLSPSSELLSAFSAFDDDDSGQVDLAELEDALLHTAPEPGEKALTDREVERIMSGFSGRRAFGKSSMGMGGMGKGVTKRGEVFKYQEFVGAVSGGNGGGKGEKESES